MKVDTFKCFMNWSTLIHCRHINICTDVGNELQIKEKI